MKHTPMWLFNVTDDPGEQRDLLVAGHNHSTGEGTEHVAFTPQAWAHEIVTELNHLIADSPAQYGGQDCALGWCPAPALHSALLTLLGATVLVVGVLGALLRRCLLEGGPAPEAWYEGLCERHLERAEEKLSVGLGKGLEAAQVGLGREEMLALLYCHTGERAPRGATLRELQQQVAQLVQGWG